MEKLNVGYTQLTQENLQKCVESNILPIFVSRSLTDTPALGLEGTSVHFPDLAPSWDLLKQWKHRGLPDSTFESRYLTELMGAPVRPALRRIELMAEICGTTKVMLMSRPKDDYLKILYNYLMS